jgi:hypothetical protein
MKSSIYKILLAQLHAIEAGAELGVMLAGEDDDHIPCNTQWHICHALKPYFGRTLTPVQMTKLRRQLSVTLEALGGAE